MNLKEVASLLGVSREIARTYIKEGLTTLSGDLIHLQGVELPDGPDVSEDDLNAFIRCLEKSEPGRHPPVSVRRELLIDAGYKCSICRERAPLEFHHIVDWAKLKHHDPQHMLAVCANCHAGITRHGQPDFTSQKEVKRRQQEQRVAMIETKTQQSLEDGAPAQGDVLALPPVRARVPTPVTPQALPQAPVPVQMLAPQAPVPLPIRAAQDASSPNSPLPASSDLAVVKQIFEAERNYSGPSDRELEWIARQLFCRTPISGLTVEETLLLRSLRAVVQVQKFVAPEANWAAWTETDRLIEITTDVLGELADDPMSAPALATAAMKSLREKSLLRFDEVDLWRPGMASGSGWTERVTLSRIAEKALERLENAS